MIQLLPWLYRTNCAKKRVQQQSAQKSVSVVPLSLESVNNNLSLFNYGLDDPYDDLIDDFDPYLEYGEGYQNRTAFKDAFYR